MLLTCVCVIYYIQCTIRCSTVKNTRQMDSRHGCFLRYGVLLSSSLHLFGFFVLVFHLKQKHEEGHRLLHYLQQTNTALAIETFIYIYICNKSRVLFVKMELSIYNPKFSLKITQESVTLWPVLRLFVIMNISYAMFILDIISLRCPFLRNKFPKLRIF